MERVILHSDLNNFYAAVECLYNPAIRERPVAVCGDVENRHGIVLAKNQIAKRCGVKTGQAIWQARGICRELVVVPPNYERYLRYSRMAREIYSCYTHQVESFGLDECWLDVTGSGNLFGAGEEIAADIRRRIRFEMGVTASVGVSYNKIFAKLGSDMKKPDATTVIARETFREQIWPMAVENLLYVGPATQRRLGSYGIDTIGALACADVEFLQRRLGKMGRTLWLFANGLDRSPVGELGSETPVKSIGNSTTTPRDLITDEDVKITLYILCESVAKRLREHQLRGQTVQLRIRENTLFSYQRQKKLETPACTALALFDAAFSLYCQNRPAQPVRSLEVRACDLTWQGEFQLSLYPEEKRQRRQERLEGAVDQLRGRFGHFILQRGVMLEDPQLSNLNPSGEHVIHPESYFRCDDDLPPPSAL